MTVDNDCIFCRIVNKEISADIIEENDNFIAIPDKNPIIDGHSLIISKKHFENIMHMPSSLSDEMISLAKKVAEKKLKKDAEGFNLIINNGKSAGQIINHIHLHIVPRKKGDNIKILG